VIKLREIKEYDLPQLLEWRNEYKDIFREHRTLTIENQVGWFQSLTEDRTRQMYSVTDADGHLIGCGGWVGIDWVNRHTGDLSIYIGDKDYQNRGYGLATIDELVRVAFEDMNMEMVRAEVFEFNPNYKVYEEAGFQMVGCWRNAHYLNGEYWDSYIMDMDRDDWTNIRIKGVRGVL